jgi:hypothetical protein
VEQSGTETDVNSRNSQAVKQLGTGQLGIVPQSGRETARPSLYSQAVRQ